MRAYPIQSYRVHARSNQSDSSRIRRQRPIAIAADSSIDDREVAAWLGLPHRSVGGYGIALGVALFLTRALRDRTRSRKRAFLLENFAN